ncbi:hypothetical protein [Nafulsella turpanensis]|uniref:hypothetical protein n=1 Tax=Nafulsella turpanensis TaxID=1265690 RepID=UPI0003458297|nr:hypothetical protein [Nafulsella turpanensis]
MGWLPIALAVLGFAFFIAIVNYNSIQARKEAIMLAFFNLCQTARARNTLLKSLSEEELLNNDTLGCEQDIMSDNFTLKHFSNYAQYIRQEKKSIENSQLLFRANKPADRETRKKIKSLQVLNHRQHIHLKVLGRKVREYNQLVTSLPTKVVAQLFGYKPLQF